MVGANSAMATRQRHGFVRVVGVVAFLGGRPPNRPLAREARAFASLRFTPTRGNANNADSRFPRSETRATRTRASEDGWVCHVWPLSIVGTADSQLLGASRHDRRYAGRRGNAVRREPPDHAQRDRACHHRRFGGEPRCALVVGSFEIGSSCWQTQRITESPARVAGAARRSIRSVGQQPRVPSRRRPRSWRFA